MKNTKWFRGDKFKPAYIGVYENGYPGIYQYWNGNFWGFTSLSVDMVYEMKHIKDPFQNDCWRGLVSNTNISSTSSRKS